MKEHKKTIDTIKEKRTVPDALRTWRKEYNQIRKSIRKVLQDGPKTIPGVAKATGMSTADTTYYLMTMRKFGEVETGEIDDMDEFFFYRLKSDQKDE